jgi:hypothetical protein
VVNRSDQGIAQTGEIGTAVELLQVPMSRLLQLQAEGKSSEA